MAISSYEAARAAYNGVGQKMKKTPPTTVQAMTAKTATTTPPAWAVAVKKSAPLPSLSPSSKASIVGPSVSAYTKSKSSGSKNNGSTNSSAGTGNSSSSSAVVGDTAQSAVAQPVDNQAMIDEAAKADPTYIETVASDLADYQRLVAQLAQQNDNRLLDYKKTATNLGYDDSDGYGGAAGTWNANDKTTGYGNAFQNQMSDFASRGMYKSSAYTGALADLDKGYGQQLSDLASGVATFQQGQKNDTADAGASQKAADTAAFRQAVALVTAKLGLG